MKSNFSQAPLELNDYQKYEIPQVEDYQFVEAINNQYPSMSPEEILDEMFAY